MNIKKRSEGKMNTVIIILIGILFASLGQVFWKIGMNSIGAIDKFSIPGIISMFLNPIVLVGLFLYGFSTVFWLVALSQKDLSYVYPFISLTFIIVLFLSYFVLKEQIGTARIIGTIIIIIGLMVVVRG